VRTGASVMGKRMFDAGEQMWRGALRLPKTLSALVGTGFGLR
jgi:hypothetical protein